MTRSVVSGLLLLAVWAAWLVALVLLAGCGAPDPTTSRVVCTDTGTAESACQKED